MGKTRRVFSPGGQPQFEVHAEAATGRAGDRGSGGCAGGRGGGRARVLGACDAVQRGGWRSRSRSPTRAHEPECPPRGLPALNLPENLRSPEIPYYLGWLNYWSAAAAQAIGFPDPARDADLLSRARRTATGGWVVQLTDAPLDLDNPAHLEALMRAYERFPEIGGRAAP